MSVVESILKLILGVVVFGYLCIMCWFCAEIIKDNKTQLLTTEQFNKKFNKKHNETNRKRDY